MANIFNLSCTVEQNSNQNVINQWALTLNQCNSTIFTCKQTNTNALNWLQLDCTLSLIQRANAQNWSVPSCVDVVNVYECPKRGLPLIIMYYKINQAKIEKLVNYTLDKLVIPFRVHHHTLVQYLVLLSCLDNCLRPFS